jgi:tRNA(fMet)-specific endonuclease VapC
VDYLLDTNACIALINGSSTPLRKRFQAASHAGAELSISTLAAFELWYGVAKSSRQEFNTGRLHAFLSGPVALLQFSDDDARAAGFIRAQLEASGTPIGAYDVLIAGQAVNRNRVLVTANVSEFSRVPGLEWQDWAAE